LSTYLLEIGTEELPAKFANSVINQFQSTIEYEFDKHFIKYQNISCTSTPRRIVLYVENLIDYGEDKTEERKGPKAEAAFVEGTPTKAAIGFAKSLNLNINDLEIRDTKKGKFVFGKKIEKGLATKGLIASIIPKTIKSLQGQRFMKWGDGTFRFSRPIRWILSLYNDEILDLDLSEIDLNLKIGNISKGHRLIKSDIKINKLDQYFQILEKNGVFVKRNERKSLITNLINISSGNLKLYPDMDSDLLDELTDLVESPNLVVGSFSEEYLSLPSEVLCTVMKNHQRYIPLFKEEKDLDKLRINSKDILSTNFLCISNGLEESKELIRKGNEKVLKARFADAKFFVEVDKKTSCFDRNQKINNISYMKGLGDLSDRVQRISFIAKTINLYLKSAVLDLPIILEACKFSKHDLCSEIVFEFPELQGLMGGKYLKYEGFNEEVALAVSEHYLPRFYKDKLPTSNYGAILSISDKLETLISIFVIGKRPTGSSDPYALRRNLNGLIQIIWYFDFEINLENVISVSVKHWKDSLRNLDFDEKKVKNELIEFTKQRILSFLEELSLAKNWINAICNTDITSVERFFNLLDIKKRINVLNALIEKNRFDKFKNVISRISKLANTGNLGTNVLISKGVINPKLFEKESEVLFYKCINKLEDLISNQWEYNHVIKIMDTNLDVLSNIFDNDMGVLINSEDKSIRINRLNLLALIRNYSLLIADFTLF
tara:strand:- start:612 stop:2765 length:2154 start_codon:yes stop_codon:yes gene_type:complete